VQSEITKLKLNNLLASDGVNVRTLRCGVKDHLFNVYKIISCTSKRVEPTCTLAEGICLL